MSVGGTTRKGRQDLIVVRGVEAFESYCGQAQSKVSKAFPFFSRCAYATRHEQIIYSHSAGFCVGGATANESVGFKPGRRWLAICMYFVERIAPKRRYWEKAEVDTGVAYPDAYPLYASQVVRPGADATVVAYGPMVRTALDAATAAAGEGRELEVIDLRSLSPMDLAPVFASVRKTGRLVVVHEATRAGGLGEVAARVSEECFYSLEAPVLRSRIRHPLPGRPRRGGVPAPTWGLERGETDQFGW